MSNFSRNYLGDYGQWYANFVVLWAQRADSELDEAYLVDFFSIGYSQNARCIHRRYHMAEQRYGISQGHPRKVSS